MSVSLAKYYSQLVFSSIIVGGITLMTMFVSSKANWGVDETIDVNRTTMTTLFVISSIMFGPFYNTLSSIFIKGLRVTFLSSFSISFVLHLIIWPLVYGFMFYYWENSLYYYFDLLWFAFSYLPIVFHVSYAVLCKGDNMRLKSSIIYTLSELAVIITALGYTIFLYPVYMSLSLEIYKLLWRIFVHTIWFEIAMLMPQRYVSNSRFARDEWFFLATLHSLFHSTSMGRMLINGIGSFPVFIATLIISSIVEIVMRLSIKWREKIINRYIKYESKNIEDGYTKHEDMMINTDGYMINMKMLLELSNLISTPFMMYAFRDWSKLFKFNTYTGEKMSVEEIVYYFFIQFTIAICTDIICVYFETKRLDLPLVECWRKQFNWKTLTFLVYGSISMSMLGMLYTTINVPRYGICKENNICTCNYISC